MVLRNIILTFVISLFIFETVSEQLWKEQKTNINDPIFQIVFIDSLYGWAIPSYYKVESNFYLIKTNNGGMTWEKIKYSPSIEQFIEIQFLDSLNGYARGRSKFYKTMDGGKNWGVIHQEYDPGTSYLPAVSMSFVNIQTGFIAYHYKLLKTTNGGLTWDTILSEPYLALRKIYFSDINIGWINKDYGGNLYETVNGGVSWKLIAENDYSPIIFPNSEYGYVKGGGALNLYKRNNSSLKNIFLLNSTDLYCFSFRGKEGLIFSKYFDNGYKKNAYLTIDTGKTYKTIPVEIEGDFVAQHAVYIDKNNFWLVGYDGRIYKFNTSPSIVFKFPIGNETFFGGSEYNLTWDANNISSGKGKLELSGDLGVTYTLIDDSVDIALGSYKWKVDPNIQYSSLCKLRLTHYSTNTVGESNAKFYIYKEGHLKLLTPQGGELFLNNQSIEIKWDADYYTSSKLAVYNYIYYNFDTTNSNYSKYLITEFNLLDRKGTIWMPDVTGFCKIRIEDKNETKIFAESNFFKVRQIPKLHFTFPNRKVIWSSDSIRTIQFQTTNIREVQFDLSIDSGKTWSSALNLTITDSIGFKAHNIPWLIPKIDSKLCLLRVTSLNPLLSTVSVSEIFEITQNLIAGYFPLQNGNTWFYRHKSGQYTYSSYEPPNIFYILKAENQVLKDDGYYYTHVIIQRWDKDSGQFNKFRYITTRYFRSTPNMIIEFGLDTPYMDFENPSGIDSAFGIIKKSYTHNYYWNNKYETLLDSIGILDYNCYFQPSRGGFYEFNKLVGAIINGKKFGETIDNIIVNVKDNIDLPINFSLSQNYPNPFNPSTKIQFVIPNEVRNLKDFSSTGSIRNDRVMVTLKVYDMLGREVATLVNEEKQPGTYEVTFNSSRAELDREGGHSRSMASGVYFYTLRAGNFVQTKKFVLMK